jgi:hypothetical protein
MCNSNVLLATAPEAPSLAPEEAAFSEKLINMVNHGMAGLMMQAA